MTFWRESNHIKTPTVDDRKYSMQIASLIDNALIRHNFCVETWQRALAIWIQARLSSVPIHLALSSIKVLLWSGDLRTGLVRIIQTISSANNDSRIPFACKVQNIVGRPIWLPAAHFYDYESNSGIKSSSICFRIVLSYLPQSFIVNWIERDVKWKMHAFKSR